MNRGLYGKSLWYYIVMKKNILIVEDDIDLNSTISKFLIHKGFEVSSVYDGQSAVEKVYEYQYNLILLDVKLPSLNGFEVAKNIREFSSVPIIFLTSLNSQDDIENGFISGADDYIIKPFSLNELVLRVEAILRRIYKNEHKIEIANNIYFNSDKLVLYKNEHIVDLTAKEITLLALFLQNQGKILSKDEIFNILYQYDEMPNEASLRVFVTKLRAIIGKDKIENIKGVGYKYV